MSKRKYSSKARYIAARKTKEYNRYLRKFRSERERMMERGLSLYDGLELKKSEYFARKSELVESDTSTGDTKGNYLNRIISSQKFQFSRATAHALKSSSDELGFDFSDITFTKIRTGDFNVEEFREALSSFNTILKEGTKMTSYQRRDYIRKTFFGYAR